MSKRDDVVLKHLKKKKLHNEMKKAYDLLCINDVDGAKKIMTTFIIPCKKCNKAYCICHHEPPIPMFSVQIADLLEHILLTKSITIFTKNIMHDEIDSYYCTNYGDIHRYSMTEFEFPLTNDNILTMIKRMIVLKSRMLSTYINKLTINDIELSTGSLTNIGICTVKIRINRRYAFVPIWIVPDRGTTTKNLKDFR